MTEPQGFKGTPGEWGLTIVGACDVYIDADNDHEICCLGHFNPASKERVMADAHVLKASKDLLAALQRAVQANGKDERVMSWDDICEARAAIAKALGKP